jgi:tetratricopeptide (TPR) repeat protein
MRWCLAVFLAALALSAARPAHAQSPAEINLAKQTAGEGLAAYQVGQYDKALGLFDQARKIYPSAQILRMIGYSELALEHWLKALEALEGSLDAKITPLTTSDRKDVQDQIAKAMAHIGTVSVVSKTAGAQLAVDGGEPRPLPLDKPLRLLEGPHKLVVTAPDHLDAVSDVKVEGGKPLDLALEPPAKLKPLPPPPPPPPPPPKPERRELIPNQRLVGLGAAGAGVLFGGAALVTLGEWIHWRNLANADVAKHLSFYGQACAMGDPRLCAFDITVTNRESTTANQLRNAAAGLGVAAGVLAAGGIILFAIAPKPQRAAPPDSAPPAAPPPQVSLRCGTAGGPGLLCTGEF